MNSDPIRVLIVDDLAPFRAGLRALLLSVPEMEVAGEAGNGEDAIREVSRLQPDVVLMDIQMPNLGGVEATPVRAHDRPFSLNLTLPPLGAVFLRR